MFPADLLPLQPIPPGNDQRVLADRHLPGQPALESYLQHLRTEIDAELATKLPDYDGKPYPLGRCREIRDRVYDRLVEQINAPSCPVSLALREFIGNGGIGRKIWGVLRESYFQNAIQIGPLYIDVANDTVDPLKPQTEILPLEKSGMKAVEDFFHFARTAQRYWECETYANTAIPGLASLFPIICVNRKRSVWLAAQSDQMIELTRKRSFAPSLDFVRQAPEPGEALVGFLRGRAARSAHQRLCISGTSQDVIESDIAESRFADEDHYRASVDGFYELQTLLMA
ncbi:hypothetical protein NUH88_17355 [Nisaea acidiphila]|uniref:Uncharacterized protein n=1 Tax=Nisaea acidiphila TaxID=1862145 RepID=A0A9J7APM0_9PROT|nr:hypothetical protein [Nisaea acidiphila]UUX49159.1 hypothetical protein NUH88_17355 [Nisaea acidiphila]